MSEAIREAKDQVLLGCGIICDRGYVLGTAGNVSVRVAGSDLFVITPTTLPYDELTTDDLVVADMNGTVVEGARKPSMEFSMHRTILRTRPDVRCVVHTHSTFATAASCIMNGEAVPIVDIETAMYIGGDIEVAVFAPPGSEDLAQNVSRALGDRAGVLMQGHGAIGVGRTIKEALTASDIVERNCELYLLIKAATNGAPFPRLPQGPLADLCDYSRTRRGMA